MAIDQADSTAALDPVVMLGLLNSMAVIVGNTETLLANWDDLCADPVEGRAMLERINAHARVITDALELAVREIPPDVVEVMTKPDVD